MARRYQPYPYRPRPSWSRRPAGYRPDYRPEYRPRRYRPRPAWSLLDLLLGRRR